MSVAKPSKLPIWDINATNIVEPQSTNQSDGWQVDANGIPQKPPFQYHNYMWHTQYKWIEYLDAEKALIGGSNTQKFKVADATLADEAVSKGQLDNKPTGMKNLIINGGFDIWQRGTSFAYTGGVGGYNTADRMVGSNQSDGQFTLSKSEINGSNAIKINVDTAVSDLTTDKYWYGFRYIFEGHDLYSIAKKGKTVTLSFLFNSNVFGEYSICFQNRTDDTDSPESYVTTFNYTTANTPQKVEIQIQLNHTFNPALLNDVNIGLKLFVGLLNQGDLVTATINSWIYGDYTVAPNCVNWGSTAGNFIEIAEMQLEEGTVATPFEHRPYGLELSLCQRYYEESLYDVDYYSSNKNFSIPIYAEVIKNKRVLPSTSITILGRTDSDISAYINLNTTTNRFLVQDSSSDAPRSVYIATNCKFDAEL